ncbi:uncharacterized protein LOC130499893 [Raphanus sativus]|uniref:Uncharacterized protein LOC130499893 n=1 Tax=Raphanus sativus TaxID=3726 RepID=A0A9W3CFK5_RAPSA|nr:uncharacterized protein LOC130499893 [Raphanus sativus]
MASGSFQLKLMVEDEKIDTAVKFYISAFGALVVNHFTDPDDHHVYELLLAVKKPTDLGAQLVGEILANDDARIEAKVTDPFGFHWVFISL